MPISDPSLVALSDRVDRLIESISKQSDRLVRQWEPASGNAKFSFSAANLAAYLALRDQDLRKLQYELAQFGLTSLGRCESRVLPTLHLLQTTLHGLCGKRHGGWEIHHKDFNRGLDLLRRRSDRIFGKRIDAQSGRIMVTLPTDCADKPGWAVDLLLAGTACVRINTAHDDADIWTKMIRNVQAAARSTGRPCRIHIDLTGPRARTTDAINPKHQERIKKGARFWFHAGVIPEKPALEYSCSCTIPELIKALKVGDSVYFNEGKLGAKVIWITKGAALLEVFRARDEGEKLRSDLAVNCPDTELTLPPLTESDLHNLDFVMKHADLLGYSFVQRPGDLDDLASEIKSRKGLRKDKEPLAVVAKIETALAVRNLPELILHGASRFPLAVMIARGDLAVELGPVRIAEIQEEILWLCEAAHIPVIWATQVLENLAKRGFASRAELTDAAMSERAECVMLNKGPHILDAVIILDEVQKKMQGHQRKKFHTLRPLRSWHHLFATVDS